MLYVIVLSKLLVVSDLTYKGNLIEDPGGTTPMSLLMGEGYVISTRLYKYNQFIKIKKKKIKNKK